MHSIGRRRIHRSAACTVVAALMWALMIVVPPDASAGGGPHSDRGTGHAVTGGWLGSYSTGQLDDVFCIDRGHASPGQYGGRYETKTVQWPEGAYLLSKWGPHLSADRAAALAYSFATSLGVPTGLARDPKPGHGHDYRAVYDANRWSIKSMDRTMRAEAARLAGPYSMTAKVTHPPTATSGTVRATFTVLSASGHPMSGYPVTFASAGAASAVTPSSATTDAHGQATVTYRLDDDASGSVHATADSLPGTSVTVYLTSSATLRHIGREGSQRFVGLPVRPSTVTATVTAARPRPTPPAPPAPSTPPPAPSTPSTPPPPPPPAYGVASMTKTDAATGTPLEGVTFRAEARSSATGSWVTLTGGATEGSAVSGGYRTSGSGRIALDGASTSPHFHRGDQLRWTEIASAPGYVLPPEEGRVTGGTVPADGPLELGMTNTPYRPTLETHARNGAPGLGTMINGGSTVIDTVDYAGLEPGVEYVVDGELVVRTGTDDPDAAADPDADAEPEDTGITGQSEPFTPKTSTGTVTVTFAVPPQLPEAWAGHDIVVFETLHPTDPADTLPQHKAVHHDLNDPAQTLRVPELETLAGDSQTGRATITTGSMTDTVTYRNLEPDKDYVIHGELMVRGACPSDAADDPCVHPSGTRAQAKFHADSETGTAAVTFAVPDALRGTVLVAYEELSTAHAPDVAVAAHRDPASTSQTVYVPAITTMLHTADGSHAPDLTVDAQGGATVADTIEYRGLEPGRDYVVNGRLVYADGESVGEDTGIVAAGTVTPAASDGVVEVTFTIPADFVTTGSVRLAAFEQMQPADDPTTTVAAHEDLHAPAQQVLLTAAPKITVISAGLGADGGGARFPLVAGGSLLLILALAVLLRGPLMTLRTGRRRVRWPWTTG